jgi:predicted component of type VI protein secretion system
MNKLYIEDEAGNVQVVPFDAEEITVGRDPGNTVVLPERNVSRKHARIRAENGHYRILDSGARYGLKLNGVRIGSDGHIFRPGDLALIGDFKVKLLAGDGALVEEPDAPPQAAKAVRRQTEQAEIIEDDEPKNPTVTLPEIEEVARQGWRSDFFDDEAVTRKRSVSKIAITGLLLVITVMLVALYILLTRETEVQPGKPSGGAVPASTQPGPSKALQEEPEPPPLPVPEPVVAPKGADARKEAVEAPANATKPEPVKPEPKKPDPKEVVKPEPKKPDPKEVVKPEPKKPEPKVAQADVKPPTPPPATPAGDACAKVDSALAGGRLGEAVGLLGQCGDRSDRVGEAYRRQGDALAGQGNVQGALSAYRNALRLFRDQTKKERLRAKITTLEN